MPSRGSVALVVLFVVVVTTPGVAAPALAPGGDPGQQTLQNRTNTSNVLGLDETARSGLSRTDLNLSAALSLQWESGRARIAMGALERRFEEASNDSERLETLLTGLTEVHTRLDELLAVERQARDAYLNGTLSTARYLERLGAIDARARELAVMVDTIQRLGDTADIDTSQTLTNRELRARARLALLLGPLRTELAHGLMGVGESPVVYLGASGEGLTLASVVGGDFIHETTRFDNFAASNPGSASSAGEALDRWAELYPEVWDATLVDFTGLRGAYRASLPFTGGNLVSYLDAMTLEVYREIQRKDLPGPPLSEPVVESRNGVEIAVQRSYPGGPLHVTFQTVQGEPRDGIVRVNGINVGRTGGDGGLWAVTPAGQFVVTVDYGEQQLTVVISPADGS
jgi:hypothetical protein